ncbi:helix-turn-helix domain-containing protein [Paenibacillus aestuarii]|uniref:Helix-turn-helix domain-containing protein n=1 Tax=Paenibacillus aestuarii TaxID=516965 RepID=A0ABW0K926_9BACL
MASKLVLIRKRCGYSIKEVQNALSINELSSIENGETAVEEELLLKFSELYHVTIDWLKGKSIHPQVDRYGQDSLIHEASCIDRGLLRDLSSLNRVDQDLVKNLVTRLKSYSSTNFITIP